jgi:hypothetical protein
VTGKDARCALALANALSVRKKCGEMALFVLRERLQAPISDPIYAKIIVQAKALN